MSAYIKEMDAKVRDRFCRKRFMALKVMEDEALQYMPQFKDNARLLFDNFCQSMG